MTSAFSSIFLHFLENFIIFDDVSIFIDFFACVRAYCPRTPHIYSLPLQRDNLPQRSETQRDGAIPTGHSIPSVIVAPPSSEEANVIRPRRIIRPSPKYAPETGRWI